VVKLSKKEEGLQPNILVSVDVARLVVDFFTPAEIKKVLMRVSRWLRDLVSSHIYWQNKLRGHFPQRAQELEGLQVAFPAGWVLSDFSQCYAKEFLRYSNPGGEAQFFPRYFGYETMRCREKILFMQVKELALKFIAGKPSSKPPKPLVAFLKDPFDPHYHCKKRLVFLARWAVEMKNPELSQFLFRVALGSYVLSPDNMGERMLLAAVFNQAGYIAYRMTGNWFATTLQTEGSCNYPPKSLDMVICRIAVCLGHIGLLKGLQQKNPERLSQLLYSQSYYPHMPLLHLALENNQLPMLRYLLAGGAASSPVDAQGNTPLQVTLRCNSLDTVPTLLSAKADIHQVNEVLANRGIALTG
jgi:hypothetical protein